MNVNDSGLVVNLATLFLGENLADALKNDSDRKEFIISEKLFKRQNFDRTMTIPSGISCSCLSASCQDSETEEV